MEGFAADAVGDLFKTEGRLNQHGHHSILQQHAINSFIFQQHNDPKHTSKHHLCGVNKALTSVCDFSGL